MKFDTILTNPPFQDTTNRKKTPHKLWVDFTKKMFTEHLADGGILCQVSPASFMSPDNKILDLMRTNETLYVNLKTSEFFGDVGSTFADYAIRKNAPQQTTRLLTDEEIDVTINEDLLYLPNDVCRTSLSIHQKVMFASTKKLVVEWDFVTCHNSLLKKGALSKEKTSDHVYPVFHTNKQTWWSKKLQPWANKPKVMWTQSGYTKPFFDAGQLGGTDMAYYVVVKNQREGAALAHNLNTLLFRYMFTTAKWSGFGNKTVFINLPALPKHKMSDEELFRYFNLDEKEIAYVCKILG